MYFVDLPQLLGTISVCLQRQCICSGCPKGHGPGIFGRWSFGLMVLGCGAYLGYACFRRCAVNTPTRKGSFVAHMKLMDSVLARG